MTHLSNTTAKLSSLRTAPKAAAFDVQKTHNIDAMHAKAIIKAAPFHTITESGMEMAASKAFPGMRYLAGSLHRASAKDPSIYGIFLSKNTRTMSMEQASASGMKKINDTVFQDSNDQIWSVQKQGDVAYLVAENDEDIDSLMSGIKSRALAIASMEVAMFEDYGAGDPVIYYDIERASLDFGIGVDGDRVFNPETNEIKPVDSTFVVNVDDANKVPVEETAAVGDGSKTALLDYYKKLYGQNSEFYARIKDMIKQAVTA